MQEESTDYATHVTLVPTHGTNGMSGTYTIQRNCKWCESGDTLDRRVRERFLACCGSKGFGPDDWFNCTECNKWGYFGEDVPDNYRLNLFVRGKLFDLLCNKCYEEELDPVWVPSQ